MGNKLPDYAGSSRHGEDLEFQWGFTALSGERCCSLGVIAQHSQTLSYSFPECLESPPSADTISTCFGGSKQVGSFAQLQQATNLSRP